MTDRVGRALLPPSGDVTPNDTVPPYSDPGTVGPPDARPGDPDGFGFDASWDVPAPPWPPHVVRPSPWSGWPEGWNTPNWEGRADDLTDVAWACVDLNASLLSTMPPYLVNASPSLSTSWLLNPNPDVYTSWEEFAKQLFWDFQLGEAFVLTTARFSSGWPARFHVVAPWLVNVDMVDGRRRYEIGNVNVTDDMLHIRYTSRVDDARGHGPLDAAAGRLLTARLLSRYAANFAAGGGIPTSVITHPDDLTAQQAADLQAQWVQARVSSIGLPAVLSGGVDFRTLQVSPRDMALADLSQLNESRIAVLLHVPPFLMGLPSGGDSMTYSNVVSLFDYHWRAGLRPMTRTVMAALSQWLTPGPTRLEVNADAYVQPGPLERAQTDQVLHNIVEGNRHAKTLDEIRLSERLDTPATLANPGVLT